MWNAAKAAHRGKSTALNCYTGKEKMFKNQWSNFYLRKEQWSNFYLRKPGKKKKAN